MKPIVPRFLPLLALVTMFPGVAVAAPERDIDQAPAFVQQPVSSAELADSVGGRTSKAQGYRQLADNDIIGFQQQIGGTARVAMDNWWFDTGLVLIQNNILAQQ